MKFIKTAFIVVLFFVLAALGTASLLNLYFWGRTRLDYLLLYVNNTQGAGSFIKYTFIVCCTLFPAVIASGALWAGNKLRLAVGLLLAGLFIYTFQIDSFITGKISTTQIYEKEYISPANINLSPEATKRNLVVLYIESLEADYADADGINLIPRLSALAKENYSFPGFYQLFYTDATISGQAAGMCGLPFKAELDNNNLFSLLNNNLPNARCLPDILKENGYNTYFIKSGSLSFANTAGFVKEHSFDLAEGVDELIRHYPGVTKKAAGNDWGIKDSVMYEIAKEKILRLAAENKPFLVMITTVDTHEPTTFLDPSCPQKFGDKRDIVFCADKMAADFLDWLQKQDFYPETTVLVLGDHISIGKNSVYPEKTERKIFNMILNPVGGLIAQPHEWTTLDIAPTVLAALGFDNNGMALGRSLWKKEATLKEKYGQKLDLEFNKNSNFYRRLQTPENKETKAEAAWAALGKQITAAEIKAYTPLFQESMDTIWADQLFLKTDPNPPAGRLCLEAEFIIFFADTRKPEKIAISLNGRPLGSWNITAAEKAPFKRTICFNVKNNEKDGLFKFSFQRDATITKLRFISTGFRKFRLYPTDNNKNKGNSN